MSDAHGIARDQLRAFIERIERLEEEKKTIAEDIKDVYGEAKSMGFDAKILRKVISIRKQDADERAEQEAILDTYLHALGMIDQPSFFDDEPRQTTPVDRKARAALRTSEAMDDNKAFSAELVAAGLISEEAHAENIALSDAVAMKLGAGVIDPETGEILDDAPVTIIDRTDEDGHRLAVTVDPEIAAILACRREQERSDGGLNIITKHTEIATSAGGESEEVAKNAVASASGPDEKRAPLFAAKPPSTRRPHCLDRAGCGSYTEEHCAPCKAAMQECEHAEEVA